MKLCKIIDALGKSLTPAIANTLISGKIVLMLLLTKIEIVKNDNKKTTKASSYTLVNVQLRNVLFHSCTLFLPPF